MEKITLDTQVPRVNWVFGTTPQAIIQSGIKTVYTMVVDGGWTTIANPSTEKYVL